MNEKNDNPKSTRINRALASRLSEKQDIIHKIHQKLLITYFDCDEYVDHQILKESISDILKIIEDVNPQRYREKR